MNQSHRLGWPGLARFIADEHPSGLMPRWADPLKWLELIPAQPSTGSGADVFRGPYYDPSNPPDADGWVKHDGSSECPLPPHTRCQILMFGQTTRDGSGFTDLPASDWFWIPVTYYRVVQP